MGDAASSAPSFAKRYVFHGKFVYHPVQVKRRQEITPRYIRITLAGPAVSELKVMSPDDDVRIVLPLDFDAIPGDLQVQYDPENESYYPEDAPPYEIKAYTVRRRDLEQQEIDIDVAIHESGLGVKWAQEARPGQTVLVGGAFGSYVYDGTMDGIVLIGDETALPAIGSWLEQLHPPVKATVIAEVLNEQEHLDLAAPAGVDLQIYWVHREDAPPGHNDKLEQAVREHVTLVPNCLYWGAGETNTMKDIRRFLANELGVHREANQLSGYWRREDDLAG